MTCVIVAVITHLQTHFALHNHIAIQLMIMMLMTMIMYSRLGIHMYVRIRTLHLY